MTKINRFLFGIFFLSAIAANNFLCCQSTDDREEANEALLDAVMEGSAEEVQRILSKHPELINEKPKWSVYFSLIEAAVNTGNLKTTQSLLDHGAEVNVKNRFGLTPLHETAKSNRRDIAQLLINHGADVNARSKKGTTPLHLAANTRSAC